MPLRRKTIKYKELGNPVGRWEQGLWVFLVAGKGGCYEQVGSGSYGGHAGYFELAVLEYPLGTDPEITSEIIEQHPIHENHGAVDLPR